MTIVLIGYMGSGKTTVGQKLSKVLSYNFADLDTYIEKKENQTISELFRSKGEIYFRKAESRYLEEIIQFDNTVISLGGGTPCYGNNMQKILSESNATSIYLKASIPLLVNRLMNQINTRPLLAHLSQENEFTEFIGKHLFERAPFYNQSALTVSVDKKSVEEIVEEIVLKLF